MENKNYLQDGSQTRKEILNRWRHLVHADNVDDSLQGRQDGSKYFGIFLAEVLVEDNAQVTHQLLFLARLHDGSDAAN